MEKNKDMVYFIIILKKYIKVHSKMIKKYMDYKQIKIKIVFISVNFKKDLKMDMD